MPNGWLECAAVGDPIATPGFGAGFLPMKVPLSEEFRCVFLYVPVRVCACLCLSVWLPLCVIVCVCVCVCVCDCLCRCLSGVCA